MKRKKCVFFARSQSQNIQRNLDSHYGFSHNHHQSYLNINKRVFCSKDSSDGVTHTGTTFLSSQCTLRTWRLRFDFYLKASNYAKLRILIFECLCIWQTVCRLLLLSVSWRGNVREGSVRVVFYEIWGELSRGEMSGSRNFPGGDCPGGNNPRGTVRGNFLGGNLPVT